MRFRKSPVRRGQVLQTFLLWEKRQGKGLQGPGRRQSFSTPYKPYVPLHKPEARCKYLHCLKQSSQGQTETMNRQESPLGPTKEATLTKPTYATVPSYRRLPSVRTNQVKSLLFSGTPSHRPRHFYTSSSNREGFGKVPSQVVWVGSFLTRPFWVRLQSTREHGNPIRSPKPPTPLEGSDVVEATPTQNQISPGTLSFSPVRQVS